MEASFKSRADPSQDGGAAGVHRRPLTGSTGLGQGRKESEGCRKGRKNGWRRSDEKEEDGDNDDDDEDGHDDRDGHGHDDDAADGDDDGEGDGDWGEGWW